MRTNYPDAVLVTDDDRINRLVLNKLLKDYPVPRIDFENGRELTDWLLAKEQGSYVILLDLNMPEMDGYEFVKSWKPKFDLMPDLHLKIIVITASAFDVLIENDIHNKVEGFIGKPVDDKLLFNKLESLYAEKQMTS